MNIFLPKYWSIYLLVLTQLTLFSCSKGPDPITPVDHPEPTPTTKPDVKLLYVVDSSLAGHYSNAELLQLHTYNDSLVYTPKDYSVDIYRLTYRTLLPDGSPILASGVVFVPRQAKVVSYPLLSLQHGTAYDHDNAPSAWNLSTPSFSQPLYFACQGYITVCPDYIGYGKADMYQHPYEHRKSLAQATVDMLRATKEFLAVKKLGWNEQLFLAGYSEGGYATLAALKMLQEQAATEFTVTASSCGSGPYATTSFFKFITTQPTIGKLANYIYVWQILSYNEFYNLWKPVNFYFKEPYASQIRTNPKSAQYIEKSFHEICTDEFKAALQDPTSEIAKMVADNDLSGWKPNFPLYLLHGDQDEYIAYLNTAEILKSMEALGSTQSILTRIPNGYHVPTEITYLKRTSEWFSQRRK
ncbi:lipase family protein [Siphonobacter sp. SORGH_AS_0500]|uniref:alpha/beta hydrolase family protein n=1 Tax=Siphonobacter sp. SORGH_AS_0500 TaxID=1864824 RepID=UPI00286299AA|nr:lipase family protein [Siphonobacter sp. SORGH_AS_0500]MDR6197226.1 pimeloyl-ACP methyl ester carboxylesterase [Siphonobacter sp. SORGH_AS_0500]